MILVRFGGLYCIMGYYCGLYYAKNLGLMQTLILNDAEAKVIYVPVGVTNTHLHLTDQCLCF